jgi:hypothetical protein
MANMMQRGIPRYHDAFSFLVARRNAIPPHSEINAQKGRSVRQYKGSKPVMFAGNASTGYRVLCRNQQKNTADIIASEK